MKLIFLASLATVAAALGAVASEPKQHEQPIEVKVFDVMAISKEEFMSNGLGTASAFTAQRSAILDGSSYLLSAVTTEGNGNAIVNGKMPMGGGAASAAAGVGASGWRRVGQYIGGGSEAEEEEFFAETDRVFERWVEAQQQRKIREAVAKRKQLELEKKRPEKKQATAAGSSAAKKSGSKNENQREGTSEASSEDEEGGQNQQAAAKASQKGGKKNRRNQQKEEQDAAKDGSSSDFKELPLALPASQISSHDNKRRKQILSQNVTIERKIKTIAFDIKSMLKRLRAAFIPDAAEAYRLAITGKTAKNADRHRMLMFKAFYDGALPSHNGSSSYPSSSDLSDPSSIAEFDEAMERQMDRVVFDMLKYYTETTTSAATTTAEDAADEESGDSLSSSSSVIASASDAASPSLASTLLSYVNPASAYPKLHTLPMIDVDELALLSDELRYLKASEIAIEKQLSSIEKGSYEKDLKLKLQSLKKGSESDNANGKNNKDGVKKDNSATIAMIESNPRDYYRALRQHSMTPKLTAPLALLSSIVNTNYNYQSQLMHSSFPIVALNILPRLRKNAAALKNAMRSNDESTAQLRKQLKEQNQVLKIINNDIAALSSISTRIVKFRQNNNVDMLGYGSTQSSRNLLLSAADVTTLLTWVNAERKTGAADSQLVHPQEFSRISRGDQPLLDGNGDSAGADDADDKNKKKSRRKSRREASSADDDEADSANRPITEWLNVAAFSLFGLSAAEVMTVFIAVCLLPILDAMIEVPVILVRHTAFLSGALLPKLRKWAGGNRLSGPSTIGKAFLAVAQGYVFVVSLMTNLHLRFGRFVLPLIGIYFCDVVEAYGQGGFQWARLAFSHFVAMLRSSSERPLTSTYQSLQEVQMGLRQRIPFTVFVLTDKVQFMTLIAFQLVLFAIVVVTVVQPVYSKAQRDLQKLLTRKTK